MHRIKHLSSLARESSSVGGQVSLYPSFDDIRRGMRTGLGYGVGLSILAAIIFTLSGGDAFERKAISPIAAVFFYLIGGAAAGLIVGCFGRLTRRYRIVRYPVGIVAAIPVSFAGTALVSHHLAGWGTAEWGTALTISLIFGIIGARVLG